MVFGRQYMDDGAAHTSNLDAPRMEGYQDQICIDIAGTLVVNSQRPHL